MLLTSPSCISLWVYKAGLLNVLIPKGPQAPSPRSHNWLTPAQAGPALSPAHTAQSRDPEVSNHQHIPEDITNAHLLTALGGAVCMSTLPSWLHQLVCVQLVIWVNWAGLAFREIGRPQRIAPLADQQGVHLPKGMSTTGLKAAVDC